MGKRQVGGDVSTITPDLPAALIEGPHRGRAHRGVDAREDVEHFLAGDVAELDLRHIAFDQLETPERRCLCGRSPEVWTALPFRVMDAMVCSSRMELMGLKIASRIWRIRVALSRSIAAPQRLFPEDEGRSSL